MDNIYSKIFVFLIFFASAFYAIDVTNQACRTNSGVGICVTISECPYALNLLVNRDSEALFKIICQFKDKTAKVCCPIADMPLLYNYNEETATSRPQPISRLKPVDKSSFTPVTKQMVQTDKIQADKAQTKIIQTDKIFPNRTVCGKCGGVESRIFGGTITEVDKHPWLARMRYRIHDEDIFGCAAGLITDRFLLTAAHCNRRHMPIGIRLGEWNTETKTDCYKDICNENTIDVRISKIINHPSMEFYLNDIALIQVEKAITFTDFIQPLCLPTTEYTALQDYSRDSVYLIAGWGLTELESESAVKLQLELNAVEFDICRNIYHIEASYEKNIICAGGIKGKDICRGDSGGPLIKAVIENYEVNWYLFGIASAGSSKCGLEGGPGIYTRVSAYMDWIREVISK